MQTPESERNTHHPLRPRRQSVCGTRMFLLLALAVGWVGAAHADASSSTHDSVAEAVEGISVVGPPLTAISTKIADPNWLVAWLLEPSRLRPGTSMPDSALSVAEAQAVARYLLAGKAARNDGATWRGGDARLGEKLFTARGCRGCHAITLSEHSISRYVPNLAGIGIKVRGDWLSNWLKSPRAYNAHTAMPQLSLTDDDIRHLVAFLLTRTGGSDIVAASPRFVAGDAAAGRAVIDLYECAKCHALKDSPVPPPAFHLAADDSTRETTLRNGRLLVSYYNCRGCHPIEGNGGAIREYLERKTLAPPTLEGEGARVQPSWLVQFVQHPTSLRPWMGMRMPNYGFSDLQARALAAYFAALSGVPTTDEPNEKAGEDLTQRGLRRFAHFKCVQCHPTSVDPQLPADADVENLSINLMLAKTRLRPSWIREFLARPKAIAGNQTRMPAVFFSTDGVPKVDHPEQDIDAIAAYLLQMTETPEKTLAKLEAGRQNDPGQKVDWTQVEY